MTYRVTLAGREIGRGTLREVRAAVAEAVTGLLAQDPEGAAEGAQTVNMAINSGAVSAALDETGTWKTIIDVNGEPHRLRITREG